VEGSEATYYLVFDIDGRPERRAIEMTRRLSRARRRPRRRLQGQLPGSPHRAPGPPGDVPRCAAHDLEQALHLRWHHLRVPRTASRPERDRRSEGSGRQGNAPRRHLGVVTGSAGPRRRRAALLAAAASRAAGRGFPPCQPPPGGFELRRGNDLTTEAAWLGQIARAYTRSPVA